MEVVPNRQQMLARMTADSFDPQKKLFLEEAHKLRRLPQCDAAIVVERYAMVT